MRSDLDRLMRERGLVGVIVLAHDRYCPAFYWCTGQKITTESISAPPTAARTSWWTRWSATRPRSPAANGPRTRSTASSP